MHMCAISGRGVREREREKVGGYRSSGGMPNDLERPKLVNITVLYRRSR